MPNTTPPFDTLSIDTVINAVESLGFLSDLRVFPLNSYENRVYQVGIEDSEPLIAKFYRPQRWSDEQIREEHTFTLELAESEVPVIPPIVHEGETLFQFEGFRFSLAPRRGGHAPELGDLDTLYTLGQHLGRIHAIGAARPFEHRDAINIDEYGHKSREFLLQNASVSANLEASYAAISEQVLEKLGAIFQQQQYKTIRLHGDCHPGNILTRPDSLYIVDLDDCRSGPAIQDLWMLISGEREQQTRQMIELLEGYNEFYEFHPRELKLIEALRTLRLMHYAAWLARRWSDPAFPLAFPWFNTENYWASHIQELKEQFFILNEPSLKLSP
jgi:Ser/Thr protein kinase RdoA (MazF antagonist)